MKKKLFLLLGFLCIIGIFSGASLLISHNQYAQAKELLKSMGINSDSLSKNEAITLWKDISEKSFDESITKDILQQQAEKIGVADLANSPSTLVESIKNGDFSKLITVRKIPKEEVRKIRPHSTYTQIIEELGATQIQKTDGSYTLTYRLDSDTVLNLDYKNANDVCPYDGDSLLLHFTCVDTEEPQK